MEESHTLKVVIYENEERPLHGKKEINCMQEVYSIRGKWLHIKGSHKILGADFNVINSLIRQCIF